MLAEREYVRRSWILYYLAFHFRLHACGIKVLSGMRTVWKRGTHALVDEATMESSKLYAANDRSLETTEPEIT